MSSNDFAGRRKRRKGETAIRRLPLFAHPPIHQFAGSRTHGHVGVGRACGVGRGLGVTLGVTVGVGLVVGVAVAEAVGVAVAVGVGVGVAHGTYRATSSTYIPVRLPRPSWCTRNLMPTVIPAYAVISAVALSQVCPFSHW